MKKSILLSLALITTMLAACDSPASSSTNTSEFVDTTSSVEVSSEVSSEEISEGYEEVSTTPVNRASAGGCLTDVAIGVDMIVGIDQTFTMSSDETDLSTIVVEFSNPELISYEKLGSVNTLHFLKAGNVIMTVKDTSGIIQYRHVVTIRDKMTPEEVTNYMVSADYYDTFLYIEGTSKFEITLLDGSNGVLTGTDYGVDLGEKTFTYEYEADLTDRSFYSFVVSDFIKTSTDFTLKYIQVNYSGNTMMAYGANLAAIMSPVFLG